MNAEKTRLLFGPYKTPPLRLGDHTSCLFRDVEVVIYNWSVAPISWPMCYHANTRALGKGILVEEELARAIQHESAMAVGYWWGVSRATVRHWRAAFGVGRMDAEGSRRLIHDVALTALNARSRRQWGEVRFWTTEELALVDKFSNKEVAITTGRSVTAVSVMRREMRHAKVESNKTGDER